MDNNNSRPNQGAEPNMDSSDWRGKLQPESRQRIVNKIMDILKRHLPVSGPEGLHELWKIAQRFEEKEFTAATSQYDYLRKISLKMLTKSQGTMANNIPPNQVGPSNKPSDPGLVMQSQVHNQGQQNPIPLPNQPQSRQQLLSQNIQNNIASQPNLPSVSGLAQTPVPNVSQNSNIQNMFNASQRQQYLYQQQLLRHTMARIHPIASSLTAENCSTLHKCIKEVIEKAVEFGADSSQCPTNWIFHSREKKPSKAFVDENEPQFIFRSDTQLSTTSTSSPEYSSPTPSVNLKSMDNNNWRPNQGAEPNMDSSDWRGQLQPETRQRIVNQMMDTFQRLLPLSSQEGLDALRRATQKIEENIFTAATSQSDYLRKISLEMLSMETKSQGTMANNIPPNQVGPSNKPPDPGLVMRSQVHKRKKTEESDDDNDGDAGADNDDSDQVEKKKPGKQAKGEKQSKKSVQGNQNSRSNRSKAK